MANAPPPPPGEIFGDYWLERRLARGGTSEVYLARQGGPGGPLLVIKRLLPELRDDPESLGLFAREAELHRLVHHPNVVEVYGAGQVAGEPFLAMQLVDGVDTFHLLRRAQSDDVRPPPALAMHIGRALCEALEAVHQAQDAGGYALGITHRDVTPSNVYLSAEGAVFLGDFGIARSTPRGSRPQLQGASLRGKHSYLAPEQISGEPSDLRADLFSCAVVVSELLIGRPLFAGAGQVAVLLAIRDGRIDALRAAARWLPLGLFDVLNRALARDPAARYPTARALVGGRGEGGERLAEGARR
ncbi:MAG: serine/threonine protein kinase, partial [Myxococcales bacterium]